MPHIYIISTISICKSIKLIYFNNVNVCTNSDISFNYHLHTDNNLNQQKCPQPLATFQ